MLLGVVLTVLPRSRISFNTLSPLLIASLLPVNQLDSLLLHKYYHQHQLSFLSITLSKLYLDSLVMTLALFQRCVVVFCIRPAVTMSDSGKNGPWGSRISLLKMRLAQLLE